MCCQVDVGEDDPLQIVCGAPNIAKGQKVIVALKGARIADNVKIKRGKIRGVVSEGMICALQEIGFSEKVAPKDYEEGIWVLPDDATPGDSVFPYLGMDDVIIDTDLTPNRGDMLSIYGNVKDLSAIYDLKNTFSSHPVKENSDEKTEDLINVEVEDEELCPTYNLRVIKNVTIKESPMWLQIRLWNSGIRPVNNVVDITNYILLKYGQPLHSFDYDKLPEKNIKVRNAHAGETMTTLDGEERKLEAQDIVVCAGDTPEALAGTMGGNDAKVSDKTVNVALEAAIFHPTNVRKQARRLDLHSESSMRFERGVNPETVITALDEAAYWLVELAGGEVTQGVVQSQAPKTDAKPIDYPVSRANHILGTKLTQADVMAIFDRLDFANEAVDDDVIKVQVPARRWDIQIKADLDEEVARLYGYDNLPSTLPAMTKTAGGLNERQRFLRASRHVLEGLGLNQAISYSLTTEERASQFMVNPTDTKPMALDYPMSQDHTHTRMNIVSGLLGDIAYNKARKVHDVALYEQGRVFLPEGGERPREEEHVAGAITGALVQGNWHQKAKQVDFYTVKGIVEQFLKNMAVAGQIDYVATQDRKEMHPGRCANIYLDGKLVGYLGQVHPVVARQYKINETYVFELNLESLLAADKRGKHYDQISKYPAITRDVAILVDKDVSNASVIAAIKEKGGAYLKDVRLFDVYEGEHMPEGKKSLAYTLTYQANDKTLEEDVVNKAFDKVTNHLLDEFNAEIR